MFIHCNHMSRLIINSGGVLERGFRRVIRDVPIGSLLIQSDMKTGEPMLLHCRLPNAVRLRHLAEETSVILLDAQVSSVLPSFLLYPCSQIGTGAAAFMAIRILLDHGVQQDRIFFVSLLVAAGGGICVLRRAFPHVKFICGCVDGKLKESWLEYRDNDGVSKRRKAWITHPGMSYSRLLDRII